jgi:hypothetical protein
MTVAMRAGAREAAVQPSVAAVEEAARDLLSAHSAPLQAN